jgi:hypothetical protein
MSAGSRRVISDGSIIMWKWMEMGSGAERSRNVSVTVKDMISVFL